MDSAGWDHKRLSFPIEDEPTAHTSICDVRSVVRYAKSNGLDFDEPSSSSLFDTQYSSSLSGDPFSPAVLGLMGGLKLKKRMDASGCEDSIVRTCLVVRNVVQQATNASSVGLFFYHEHTNELRTFVSGGVSLMTSGGGISAATSVNAGRALNIPPRSPLGDGRRKFSTAGNLMDWQPGLLYHFDASQSLIGKVFQALSRHRVYCSSASTVGVDQVPMSPYVWIQMPVAAWKPPILTSVHAPINTLLSEILWSRMVTDSHPTKDPTLFILLKGSVDAGNRALGLLAIRDPIVTVPPCAQPAMIRYLAHLDCEVMPQLGIRDENAHVYTPKTASEAAVLCFTQGLTLWLDLSLRVALKADIFRAEVMKREFLLSLTQYVCKDPMDVGKAIERFERTLLSSFESAIALAFVVDDVSREFVRVRGGSRSDPVALPFSHCVLRRCLNKADPLISFISWRAFWRSGSDHDEPHDTRVVLGPLDNIEKWLQSEDQGLYTPSPSFNKKNISRYNSIKHNQVARSAPLARKLARPQAHHASLKRIAHARREGPKIFLPLRTADGMTKLLLVLTRKPVAMSSGCGGLSRLPIGSQESFVDARRACSRFSKLQRTDSTGRDVTLTSGENIYVSTPASPMEGVMDPFVYLDWQTEGTFGREFIDILRDISELLSVELRASLSRYVLESLMLISHKRRESAPSHSILESVFGPTTGSGTDCKAEVTNDTRRASAPFIYNLYSSPRKADRQCLRGAALLEPPFLSEHFPPSSVDSPSTSLSTTDKALELASRSITSTTVPSPDMGAIGSKQSFAPVVQLPVPCLSDSKVLKLTSKLQDLTSNVFPPITGVDRDAQDSENMYRMFATWEIDWWYIPVNELASFFEWSQASSLALDQRLSYFGSTKKQRGAFFTFIANSYRNSIPYHNFYHAIQVFHTMWMLLSLHKIETCFKPLELYTLMIAALCHDVDHPGVTNQFLIASEDTLAIRYNDISVLEHHHAAFTFQAMRTSPERDITANMDKKTRVAFRQQLIEFILATDMQKHSKLLSSFTNMLHHMQDETNDARGDGELVNRDLCVSPWEDESERRLLGQILIHGADLSNAIAPFPYFLKWGSLCIEEFNKQVDHEIALSMDITAYMNCRTDKSRIEMELGFCEFVVLPLWRQLAQVQSSLEPWVKQGTRNSAFWRACLALTEKVQRAQTDVANDEVVDDLEDTIFTSTQWGGSLQDTEEVNLPVNNEIRIGEFVPSEYESTSGSVDDNPLVYASEPLETNVPVITEVLTSKAESSAKESTDADEGLCTLSESSSVQSLVGDTNWMAAKRFLDSQKRNCFTFFDFTRSCY